MRVQLNRARKNRPRQKSTDQNAHTHLAQFADFQSQRRVRNFIAVEGHAHNARVGLQQRNQRGRARVAKFVVAEIQRGDGRVAIQRGGQRGNGRVAQTLIRQVETALRGGQLGANVATETQSDRKGQVAGRARSGGGKVGIALRFRTNEQRTM